jgi:hypothetical protein
MWWGAFLKRHHVLGFIHGQHRSGQASVSLQRHAQRARQKLQNPPALVPGAKWVKGKLRTPPPSVEQRRKLEQAGITRAKGIADGQVGRALKHEYGEAKELVRAAPETEARISAKRAELEQLQHKHADANAKADVAKNAGEVARNDPKLRSKRMRKREVARYGADEKSLRQGATDLHRRMNSLQGEIAGDRDSLATARQTVEAGSQAERTAGKVYTRAQADKYARFLDAQAALPAGERDYARAAGVADYGRRQYEALDDAGKQAARGEIDRELAVRKGVSVAAREVARGGGGTLRPREQGKVEKQFGQALEQEVNAEGHELPSSLKPRPKRSAFDTQLEDWRDGGSNGGGSDGGSSMMRDAHKVMAGRKRQLGRERRP